MSQTLVSRGHGIRAITFDCYGTLIDVVRGRGAFLREVALRSGEATPPPGDVLADEWAAIQFELLRGRWKPYRDVIGEALRQLAELRSWRCSDREGELMVRATVECRPYNEVRSVLESLRKAGYILAIVSNTDRAILEPTLQQLGRDTFDEIVTSEDCQAYKPDPQPLMTLIEQLNQPPDRVLHVAGGYHYDIPTASKLGCRTAWINRRRVTNSGPVQPEFEWPNLHPLAEMGSVLTPRHLHAHGDGKLHQAG